MLTDEMKSMAYLINKEILKIFPYEYIKEVCSGEITMKEIAIEGLLSIQAGENPRVIEEKLKSFLAPADRASDSAEGGEEVG